MKLKMRNIFIKKLTKAAESNNKIVLIVGDLGYSVIEEFKEKFPNRFYNAGISEQNMASMAAGLASVGFHVFVYSIANFPTFRCAEQLRNDVGYHNLPVTVVAVGGGVSYGNLGYSHHAVQDFGLMRLFPEFDILSPGDPFETEMCMDYLLDNPGPSYLRLKKAGEPNYNSILKTLKPGIWNEVDPTKNNKILLTTSGGLHIAQLLKKANKEYSDYGIYSCPIWGPKFKKLQQNQIDNFEEITTVEDHLIDCGFGSWLRESITKPISHIKLINKALSQDIIGKVGSEEYLLKQGGFIF
jgi:transketolase